MGFWGIFQSVVAGISTLVAILAIYNTVQLQKQQMLLEKRQFLLPLWKELQELDDINPISPVWKDVIKAVNVLELIAIACEGDFIDIAIIKRMYSRLFIDFYNRIEDCKNPPPEIFGDGKSMILACPAIINLYNELLKDIANKNKITHSYWEGK